jgi:hypothetical protein
MLTLYDQPTGTPAYRMSLSGLVGSWRRTVRSIGGYHLGKMRVRNLGIEKLSDFFNTWLGFTIYERTYGITTYEGIIWQLDLIKNGINYRRTLDPRVWHNRVNVYYSDANWEQQTTGWSENTSSSDIYGEMEYIYSLGAAVSGGATALRDRALIEYAWPESKTVGSVDVSRNTPISSGEGLYITTAGFGTTMNWQYYTADTSATASSLINTLVGTTEFVSAGRIETNSLSTRVACSENPQRVGDLIEQILSEGDSSGNIWNGGVYANQEFVYESAPTTVDYYLLNGILYSSGGIIVNPHLLKPGFYIRDVNAPTTAQPAGTSNVFDDPQVVYCNEVEVVWPNLLRLKFPGQSQTIDILQEQLAGYQHPQLPITPDVPPPAPPPTPSDPAPPPTPPGIPMPNQPPPSSPPPGAPMPTEPVPTRPHDDPHDPGHAPSGDPYIPPDPDDREYA